MGLDALDLCFRLEKKFGLSIKRDEAVAVLFTTPGTIHRHLLAKLSGQVETVPAFESLYLEVAQAIGRHNLPQKPGFVSRLLRIEGESLSPEQRLAIWRDFENTLGCPLPDVDHEISQRFFQTFPKYDPVSVLTLWIMENHPARIKEWVSVSCERKGKTADRQWSEEEVWDGLVECITGALGVKRAEVTPNARMIEDLGIN